MRPVAIVVKVKRRFFAFVRRLERGPERAEAMQLVEPVEQ